MAAMVSALYILLLPRERKMGETMDRAAERAGANRVILPSSQRPIPTAILA